MRRKKVNGFGGSQNNSRAGVVKRMHAFLLACSTNSLRRNTEGEISPKILSELMMHI